MNEQYNRNLLESMTFSDIGTLSLKFRENRFNHMDDSEVQTNFIFLEEYKKSKIFSISS